MSLPRLLNYHLQVDAIGAAWLRWERWSLERRLRQPWTHPHLNPPLGTSPRLKQLISRHYLRGRHADGARPVAWVTSGGPVEFLMALGYYVLYPENHGAVCGIRRVAQEYCEVAEGAGYSPDLCSYARTDLGAVFSGRTPVGRLPRPDILLCCTNICQTVLHWYQVLAHRFQVPLVLVDTPFLYQERAPDHAVDYVYRQLQQAVESAERAAGRSMDMGRLEQVTRRSQQSVELWAAIMEQGRHRPSPITVFDEFIHMAPIVEMRGEADTVAYYRALLAELEQRARQGVGALKHERARMLWDNLPIWHRMSWLSRLLAARGVALVASTYTNAWGELAPLVDPARPLRSAARLYLHPILNRGTGHKLATMRRMAEAYQVDGVILHSDRSCKPYSIGQMGQRHRLLRELGVPATLLEADHNDPRLFSESQVTARLEAFLEMVGV